MPPRRKLRIANMLMGLGMIPFALVFCWALAFLLTTVPGEPPKVPIIDPIGMVGLLVTSFVITAVVAGTSALWSWSLTSSNIEIRSWSALAFRLATVLLLSGPVLLSYLLRASGL
jgi:CHASE2 domain-containing sensor protein